jgi:cytochrome P450
MDFLELLIALFVVGCSVKFFYPKWILFKLNIPDLNKYSFFIDLFYPLFKLALASAEERFRIINGYCEKFPVMLKLWLGPKMVIFVNDPDRVQKVLMSPKCLEKMNFFYELMERNTGLVSASARKKWKAHRKFFNFSFSLSILDSFLPTYIECSNILVENLLKKSDREEIDFFDYAKKASFDILCATSLGTDIKEYRKQPIYEKVFEAFET